METYNKNTLYAPGIATYGSQGERGQTGLNGFSIYYIPDNINDDNSNYIIKNYISKNRIISNNYTNNNSYLNDRPYQYSDLFLTPNGKIYKYVNINNEKSLLEIGEIINDNLDLFDIENKDNKIVYLNDSKKLCIGGTNKNNNYSALLNIILNKDSSLGYISLYNNDNNQSLSISNTTNDDILISNNNNLLIDNLFINNDNINDVSYNNTVYYKPLSTYNFNISTEIDTSNNLIVKIPTKNQYMYNIYKFNDNSLNMSMNVFDEDISILTNDISMITLSSINSYVSQIIYDYANSEKIKIVALKDASPQNNNVNNGEN